MSFALSLAFAVGTTFNNPRPDDFEFLLPEFLVPEVVVLFLFAVVGINNFLRLSNSNFSTVIMPEERDRLHAISFEAETEGFEPSIQFPVYTLSRRAPSTTRTSLQKI